MLRSTLVTVLKITLLLTAVGVWAQEPHHPGPDDEIHAEVSAKAAEILGEFFLGAGIPASVQGPTVEAFGRTVTVQALVEFADEEDGVTKVGAIFRLEIDGEEEPKLRLGSAGAGPSVELAAQQAAFDWAQALGPGIAVVLNPAERYPMEIPIRSYGVYPGNMVIRGVLPDGWVDGSRRMQETILGQIAGNLVEGESLMTLELQIAVMGDDNRGECRINGEKTEALCGIVRLFPWPAGEYLFKQFYILVPAQKKVEAP